MKRGARLLAVLALGCIIFLATGCSKLRARDQLNKGVQAYRVGQYESAIQHFQNAIGLDPNLATARLYLATALAQQCVPGVDTPENMRVCNQAIDEFKHQLQVDPKSVNSLKGIASLYFNMKKLDDAKNYHKQVIELQPSDADPYYSIAVIDWTDAYKEDIAARNSVGMNKPDEPLKDKKACQELRSKNLDKVNEGIDYVNKALEQRKDYDDAMVYMNLLYRQKADIECGDPAAQKQDLDTAQQWVTKTLETRKLKEEKKQGPGGIVLEEKKP
jgi:tetratricopeptide (TPR) repeat protein